MSNRLAFVNASALPWIAPSSPPLDELPGVGKLVRQDGREVANAVGAAFAQIGREESAGQSPHTGRKNPMRYINESALADRTVGSSILGASGGRDHDLGVRPVEEQKVASCAS